MSATAPFGSGTGIEEFGIALEMFREIGDRTMEAWTLHMLGSGLLRNGDSWTPEATSSMPCDISMPPAMLPASR